MTEDQSSLKQLVRQLHDVLQDGETLDDESTALLEQLGTDIDRVVEGDEEEDLQDRIGHAVESFEAEHPTLTSILNRIATTLSGLGI